MFQANYYKKDKYHVDILLLGENVLGGFTRDTLEEAVEDYITFEEDYYNYKFSKKEKELRFENAKLLIELNTKKDKEVLSKILEVNQELQQLYMVNGFDQIKEKYRFDFKNRMNNGLEVTDK